MCGDHSTTPGAGFWRGTLTGQAQHRQPWVDAPYLVKHVHAEGRPNKQALSLPKGAVCSDQARAQNWHEGEVRESGVLLVQPLLCLRAEDAESGGVGVWVPGSQTLSSGLHLGRA